VQRHYSKATTNVNDELEKRFPTQDVMDALGILHINYFKASRKKVGIKIC
jgi:hypothetical protein